jgi:hypothetical protein
MFSDVKAQSAEERADWLDYGKDYYAAVSWNDVPGGRRLMIGWANNWQYGGAIPTSPWRSAMSVPRELALKTIDGKLQVVQQPVDELQTLRTGRAYHIADEPIVDSARTVERCTGKALELVAELAIGDARQTGLVVRAGDGQETVIGYDADTHEVYVDRTRSGRVDFSRNFPGVQRAPLEPRNGKVRLHILVDWSLIEVYADQGQRVITDQVFPADSSQGLKVFAAGGSARLEAMDVWTLRSIWNGESDAGQCAPRAEQANENPGGAPNPGPVAGNGTKRKLGRVASVRASARCYYNAVLARAARTARRSMRFTYRLTAAAPVRLTVRRRNGSPAWTFCPPRRGKKPFPYTDVDTWNEDGQAGQNRTDIGTADRRTGARKLVVTRKRPHARGTVALKRMLQGKRLRAGTYVLAVASLNDKGRVTSERHVKFWVVTPRSSR